jgi:hypothetical protein
MKVAQLHERQRMAALLALRDCTVIRARPLNPGYRSLVQSGEARAWPAPDQPGRCDFRLTERGLRGAQALP